MENALPDLLTADEVAQALRVKTSSVYRWAKVGVLPEVRIGGVVRFRREDVETLLAGTRAGEATQ